MMKKHPLYYFSPCVILSIVVLVKIVIGFQALMQFVSWKFYSPIFEMFGALLIPVIIDWLVKKFTKGNIIYIWVIETLLISIGLYFFRELEFWILH